ncbi:HEAT repeat domain-containing protein [Caloramator sp. E03]|uniref:HEAT repeat domain-containing protein n=1 Tax=Caloramator sp. E03 TaxID=2576307 RepID=UPI001110A7E3|nr:HEAT repeat domain-containing protein [Caloramator sp. E03]QCX32808.1 HEAT repeat domain-containing protein [Caloramator sp. E03]
MKNISWDDISKLSDSEITYLLYLEGKSIDVICKIRNLEKSKVEKQIIECKIKYRIFENSKSEKDIITKLKKCFKSERLSIIELLQKEDKENLENYVINNLFNCSKEDCSFYIWLLGELKSKRAVLPICAFLKSNDGNIKRICCSALGKIGDVSAEDALISCLNDEKPQVVQYAIKSLGKIKSKKALPYLNKIINTKNQKEYIINSAIFSIKEIIKGDKID